MVKLFSAGPSCLFSLAYAIAVLGQKKRGRPTEFEYHANHAIVIQQLTGVDRYGVV
jgi:hypothetical protein